MNAITYTAARENLASTMDQVCRDRAPMIITRNRDQAVVMISLDEFEALEANARRLLESIRSLESGKGKQRGVNLDA
jgi:antitoxin YefM